MNFRYTIDDFDDSKPERFVKKTSGQQLSGRPPMKTSASNRGIPQVGVTTLSISDIMQGAALYRPKESTLNAFNQTLSTDLQGLLKWGGGENAVLGEGRASLLPFDIMLKDGFGNGYFDNTTTEGKVNIEASGEVGQFLTYVTDELGTTENPRNSNMNPYAEIAGHANGQAWCATFIVAMCKQANVTLPPGADSAYTPAMAEAFKAAGQWFSTPEPGDIVFFDFPNDSKNRIQHVGIVEQVISANEIITIEGNTSSSESGSQDNGGGVWRKTRNIQTSGVQGFGRPVFAKLLEDEEEPEEEDDV